MKNILFFMLIICLISCKRRKTIEYVVSESFEGPIFLFYNIKIGKDDKIINNKVVFNIPENGIYYTKLPFGNGGLVEYYIKYKNGYRKRIYDYEINYNTKKDTIFLLYISGSTNNIGTDKEITYNYDIISNIKNIKKYDFEYKKHHYIIDSISNYLIKNNLVEKEIK